MTLRADRFSPERRTVHPSDCRRREVVFATYWRMSRTWNVEVIARPISLRVMSSDTLFLAS